MNNLSFRPWLVAPVLGLPLLCAGTLVAAPKGQATRVAAAAASKPAASQTTTSKPLPPTDPRYLTLEQIKRVRARMAAAGQVPGAALQPVNLATGEPLRLPFKDLLTGPAPDYGAMVKKPTGYQKVDPQLFAQAFPRPVPPASPRALPAARVTTPRWVRYPLEFQLAGIGLGTRAVDKDRFNRIDRYGLFALHGNPTAVVRAIPQAAPAEGATGGGSPAGDATAPPAAGGEGGAGAAAPTQLTLQQTPPELATLFPNASPTGGLPAWALAVTVQLDNNHVEWLYQRDTYSMGFVVDRLGFVDAIIVAGTSSPIARTQLEDPIHTVKLGDDLRKVLFRYGYPDDIVPLAADPAATANAATGAPGGGAGGAAGGAGAAAGGAAVPDNAAYRTYDLRYEQSYNVVFTIRNNRVVRIYIFGDPDFFNAQRRQILRTRY